MLLINERHKAILNSEVPTPDYFWSYDHKQTDFFINEHKSWQNVSDSYLIKIGKYETLIPYNYFILIGDMDSGFDCIKPEEIVGREFEVLTFSNEFSEESWELEKMSVIGFRENVGYVVPENKCIFPSLISPTKCIMISNMDMYNKIKKLGFNDIV